MALADPQSVTVAGVAATLPRTSTLPDSAVYKKADNTLSFKVQHNYAKRVRRSMRIDFNAINTNPYDIKEFVSGSVILTVDVPTNGFSNDVIKDNVLALTKWVNDGSAANLLKVLGGES